MTDKKKIEVVFAPGCFDHFEGTQEELDALIKEIQDGAESGALFEKSNPVSIEDLLEELSDEEIEDLLHSLDFLEDDPALPPSDLPGRTLQ